MLLIALPAVASAQAAPAPGGGFAPPPPKSTPSDATPSAPTPASSPAPRLATAAPQPDPAQCRIACAQTSYFCRAGDDPDGCDGAWSQCVAACDLPSLGPAFSTGP